MPSPPTWSETIDNLFTTTWQYRQAEAIEQSFLKTPFIYWLREKGHVENLAGYRQVEIPLDYGSNETVAWIGKGSTVPVQDSELVTLAYEVWRYVACSIVRWMTEDQQNRGQAQAIRLVETKLNAAERSLWEEMELAMFSDGTGVNEPNGLQNLIPISGAPTATGQQIIHGLDRYTYSWWQPQQKASSGSAAVYLVSDMRTAMNNIVKFSRAEVKDICMVTDQTTYELYEDVCLEMKILQNQTLADAAFDSIVFKGRPIMWCPSCPIGNMWFMNPAHMKLYVDEENFMHMTDWKLIPDQPEDRVAQILCTMNLVIKRAVDQLVLTGIAA